MKPVIASKLLDGSETWNRTGSEGAGRRIKRLAEGLQEHKLELLGHTLTMGIYIYISVIPINYFF